MTKLLKTLGITTLSALGAIPASHASVINFEGYGAGTIIDSEYSPAVTISAVNAGGGPDLAVIFDTENPTGGDDDLGGPFDTNNLNLSNGFRPGNVLILQERFNCDTGICLVPDDEGSRAAGTFFFEFETAVTLNSIDFFDIETEEDGSTAFNSIRLFDSDDTELMPGLFYTPDTGGDNMWDQVVFDVSGVKRFELNMGGSGAIDNIAYTSVIPVPAAIWLFTSGLLSLFGLARRRS